MRFTKTKVIRHLSQRRSINLWMLKFYDLPVSPDSQPLYSNCDGSRVSRRLRHAGVRMRFYLIYAIHAGSACTPN